MRKIRKIINSIALLVAPSVAFSALTRDQFIDFLSRENMRDENNDFTMQAIADAGLLLINEGEGSKDELVKNLRTFFIDTLNTTSFIDRALKENFFFNLKSLGGELCENREVLDFIIQVTGLYNFSLWFFNLQGWLFYNQFVTAFNEGNLNNLIAQMDDTALHNIEVLINYFRSQEVINNIDNPNVDVHEHPEVMFFSLICDSNYGLASFWGQLYLEKCQGAPVVAAFEWICSEAKVKALVTLRVLLVNPDLAREFLLMREQERLESEARDFFDHIGNFVDEELVSEKNEAPLGREAVKVEEAHREPEDALPEEQNDEKNTTQDDFMQKVDAALDKIMNYQLKHPQLEDFQAKK